MLFGVPGKRFFQFIRGHLRQNDVLHNHRMTVDTRGDFRRLDFVLVEDSGNSVSDRVQFHYLAVYDRIGF